MDSPQRREFQFPRDSPPAANAPWNTTTFLAPQHPQTAPPSYLCPVSDQLHGVVRDVMVSNGIVILCSPINDDTNACAHSSSLQQMLPVIISQSRTGRICPRLSKTMLRKVNCRACGMLTCAITTWPMITFRYMSIAIML